VGSISNYSGKIFLLKGLVSLLLIIAMIANSKMTNDKWQQMTNDSGFKKLLAILFLFISYLALTLTYSSNPAYGFQKILNFIISIVPSVLVFYYLISSLTELRIKLFIYSLGIISVLTVSYIIIVYPFDQGTIYHYEPGRWSHVIYGRMISSIAVVLLLYLIWMIGRVARLYSVTPRQVKEERGSVLLLIIVTSLSIYGTYLSALRAAFVGLMLVGGGLLVISAWFVVRSSLLKNLFTGKRIHASLTKDQALSTKEQITDHRQKGPVFGILSTLLVVTILSALLIFLVPKPDIINYRFDNMIAIDDLQFKGDPAIHSRLDYWQLSLKIIKDNPVIGVGMGGFSSYHKVEVYPHNIILEFAVEGGAVGLLVLCSLFVVIFKFSYRFSKCHPELVSGSAILLLTFFLFALWLSMFSKEFSNQTVLWIGLAFVGLKRDD